MKRLYAAVALIVLTFASVGPSSARVSGGARPQSVAGVFDYYLLVLSWSPTYCLTHRDDAQCSGKGYGFVLHGLWPQYARGGWPKSCAPRLRPTRMSAVRSMPSPMAASMADRLARTTRSSGQLARQTTATGQSAP